MKQIHCLFAMLLILCCAGACTPLTSLEKQREARSGLDTIVSQISPIADFVTNKIVYREFYDDEHGGEHVCYYAKAFFVIGSLLPAENLPEVYAERLQALGLGWKMQDYDNTILYRGKNERAVVFSVQPDDAVKNAVDYAQLRKIYPSIIFLQLEYILPSRDEC
jgi:hypothetical protein